MLHIHSDVRLTVKENQTWAIIGASGWIGSTILELALTNNIQVKAFGSKESIRIINGQQIQIQKYHPLLLLGQFFDVIWDAAFVTRERLLRDSKLSDINEDLTNKICQVASENPDSTIIYFSSGAAVHDALAKETYGLQKKQAEDRLLDIKSKFGTKIKIVRVWNVSGRQCPKPEAFALTSMLQEAIMNNSITIRSTILRWRRYSQLTQILYAAMLFDSKLNILDTGGPIVELRGLADAIQEAINRPLSIIDERVSSETESYYSESNEYEKTLESNGVMPASLIQQIQFLL